MQHAPTGRIDQATADQVAADHGDLPTNLPHQLTRFVGREREREELQALLADARLLTVAGAGGMGKSRLALHVAADVAPRFPDGVWLVELAPISDPHLLPQAIASACHIGQVPSHPSAESLAATIGRRQLLLVLDNCEHLVEPCARLVDHLLRSCPHLRILSTSREPLGVLGETVWRIPPLSTPAPRALPDVEAAAEFESVRLFLDRARLFQPSFTLDNQNCLAVADICVRLEGIPLAIELAAARVGMLGVEQLTQRLVDRFGLLTGGSRTAASRQQTLQATIDWSYRLLTGPERALFARLAVFAGGASLQMIEAVCAGHGLEQAAVLDILGRLVDKSLVIAEPLQSGVRYRQLETLRQYGWERLVESGDLPRWQQQHASHVTELGALAGPELTGPRQVAWADRLQLEHDNLRTALAWIVEQQDAERGLRLAGAIWRFWSYRGYLAEGRRWLTAVLELPTPPDVAADAALRGDVLFGAGRLAHQQGDYRVARPLYETCLAIARRAGHAEASIGALAQLGHLALYEENLALARHRYEEALTFREAGRTSGALATALAGLAYLEQLHGKPETARHLYSDGLAQVERLGDLSLIAYLQCRLGELDHDEGRLEEARARFETGLMIYRSLQARTRLIGVLENFAGLAASQRQTERALRLAGAADALRAAIGARPLSRESERLARLLEPARRTLTESTALACWREGQAMSLDQALEHALVRQEAASSVEPCSVPLLAAEAPDGSLGRTNPLTVRETEVAVLIARGLTNREIAQELVISERTTEAHVTHILGKLGLRSRAQVAVWALEHGLTALQAS